MYAYDDERTRDEPSQSFGSLDRFASAPLMITASANVAARIVRIMAEEAGERTAQYFSVTPRQQRMVANVALWGSGGWERRTRREKRDPSPVPFVEWTPRHVLSTIESRCLLSSSSMLRRSSLSNQIRRVSIVILLFVLFESFRAKEGVAAFGRTNEVPSDIAIDTPMIERKSVRIESIRSTSVLGDVRDVEPWVTIVTATFDRPLWVRRRLRSRGHANRGGGADDEFIVVPFSPPHTLVSTISTQRREILGVSLTCSNRTWTTSNGSATTLATAYGDIAREGPRRRTRHAISLFGVRSSNILQVFINDYVDANATCMFEINPRRIDRDRSRGVLCRRQDGRVPVVVEPTSKMTIRSSETSAVLSIDMSSSTLVDDVADCEGEGSERGGVMSAMEVADLVRSRIPGLDIVLKGVIGSIVGPIATQISSVLISEMGDQLNGNLQSEIGSNAPYRTSEYVTAAVTYNLNAVLTDSVTRRIVESLTQLALDTLGPSVSTAVHRNVASKVRRSISETVATSLIAAVNDDVASDLSRSLLLSIAADLTRSITHAIVPTLSRALSHNAERDAQCEACASGRRESCSKCPYSPEASYYQGYYSTYYSDYYSSYYADYYADAVRRVDHALVPKRVWRYTDGATSPSLLTSS